MASGESLRVKRSDAIARLSLHRVGLPLSKHLMRQTAQPE